MLYPLKFKPLYKERIWGGENLKNRLNKRNTPSDKIIGESWELSDMPDGNESVVSEGYLKGNTIGELVETYMGDLVGDSVYELFGDRFPLLVKLIDSGDCLSVQVHPNDELALERHESYGKTELWYIIDHEPEAELLLGFSHNITLDEYYKAIETDTIADHMNHFKVSKGESYYIPSGTIHTIGKGILVAEIQQPSDITYRLYDWGRRDSEGNLRELHLDEAQDVLDFSHHSVDYYKSGPVLSTNHSEVIRSSQYFTITATNLDGSCIITRDYVNLDSFVVYLCTQGSLNIECGEPGSSFTTTLNQGETLLIPAIIDSVDISGIGSLLESTIEIR